NFWRSPDIGDRFAGWFRPPATAHNQILETILSGGLITLVALVVLLRRVVGRSTSLIREGGHLGPGYAAVAALLMAFNLGNANLLGNGHVAAIFIALTAPPALWDAASRRRR